MKRKVWTHKLETQLERLVAERLTTSQIASQLNHVNGTSFTRNAIIGKCNRSGLQLGHIRPHQITPAVLKRHAERAYKHAGPPAKPKLRPLDVGAPKPLGDVTGGCRWLHGEASQRKFCGNAVWRTTSWCDHHARQVFNFASTAESTKKARVAARLRLSAI